MSDRDIQQPGCGCEMCECDAAETTELDVEDYQ